MNLTVFQKEAIFNAARFESLATFTSGDGAPGATFTKSKFWVFRFYAFWCVVMRREVIPILSLLRLPIPPLQLWYCQSI